MLTAKRVTIINDLLSEQILRTYMHIFEIMCSYCWHDVNLYIKLDDRIGN